MTVGRPKHPNFWADLLVSGKADFTTPEWIESYKRAKELTGKYFDPSFSGIDYPTGAGLFASGKYGMWPEGSFSAGDIYAAKPTFQKLDAFIAPWSDNAADNAVQPVYGDIGWAGLKYSKNVDVVKDWIDFFGQKDNYTSFMQVLQYYPTMPDAQLTGPIPATEKPLLAKTGVSMVRLPLPGMTYDNQWSELILSDNYTPETYAATTSRRTSRTPARSGRSTSVCSTRSGPSSTSARKSDRLGPTGPCPHAQPGRSCFTCDSPRRAALWVEPQASGPTCA